MAKTLEQTKNLKNFLEGKTKQRTQTSSIAIIEIDQESKPSPKEVIGTISTYKQPKNPPFYVSMKIMD